MAFYEGLRPESLDRLPEFYAADARFVDPFNDVVGRPAIRRLLAAMFDHLEAPRFVVAARHAGAAGEAMLAWRLDFRSRLLGGAASIEGATRLVFDADGRVRLHRDYWDAGELYTRLPLLGAPLRLVRRRLGAGPAD